MRPKTSTKKGSSAVETDPAPTPRLAPPEPPSTRSQRRGKAAAEVTPTPANKKLKYPPKKIPVPEVEDDQKTVSAESDAMDFVNHERAEDIETAEDAKAPVYS